MENSVWKWTKYKIMNQNPKLSIYLPETMLFSSNSMKLMLGQYNEVIFKPCRGYKGKGVIHIDKKNNSFVLHEEMTKKTIDNQEFLLQYLKERSKKRGPHIIQQRIPLAKIHNNFFDIRVMVQRKKNSSMWCVTGKAARITAPGFIISNATKEIITLEQAIFSSKIPREMEEILAEIEEVGLLVSLHLQEYYPENRAIGIDIGLDDKGKVWIIEANLQPSIAMFQHLKDETIYKTINEFFL